jgi:hypothetical protein
MTRSIEAAFKGGAEDKPCISEVVARGKEGTEAAHILLSQAIPCIMHLENRVGEKPIMVLLTMGAKGTRGKETSKV